MNLLKLLRRIEARIIKRELKKRGGNVSQTARDLQIGRTTLIEKIERLGIKK